MSELTTETVKQRYETVASGTYEPVIPGLPGLVFVRMGLKERGASSRAYSSRLKELYAEGGYFSEAMLPTVLKKACKENGIDIAALQKQQQILKRFYDNMPKDLQGSVDELTEEEIALLPPEERAERENTVRERGKRIMEYIETAYTADETEILEQVKQIEALEQHLCANTAEHHARMYRDETEILLCARRSEDAGKPYFESIDEIEAIGDTDRETLVQLFLKWRQWKDGLPMQFFRADGIALQGVERGVAIGGG